MRGVQLVFHQAALASVPLSVERPREFHEVNVTGTLNVLEAAAEAKVSARDVRRQQQRVRRDARSCPSSRRCPPTPLSPYAASKVAGEGLMRA